MKHTNTYAKETARRWAEVKAGKRAWHDSNKDELPIEKLRRVVNWLDYEPESILQDLPTTAAVEEYFDLQWIYGTDFLEGIKECIAEGDTPAPLIQFIDKHKLGWDAEWLQAARAALRKAGAQ